MIILNLFWKQRLSNLRIHANFNDNLCRAVSKTCARVGALDFGEHTESLFIVNSELLHERSFVLLTVFSHL